MSGLTAAIELERCGIGVVIVDKGRAVGGRMASRRVGPARFDHGAQHFSARDARFSSQVDAWTTAGLVRTWFRSQSLTNPDRGEEPRNVPIGGMRNLPEHLAAGLDVRTGVVVTAVSRTADGATVRSRDQPDLDVEGVILTAPVPQTMTMLEHGDIKIPPPVRSSLEAIRYDACLAVMAELDGPSGLPDGHLSPSTGPVAWIGDNQDKGTSAVPAVTIHSTPEFADDHQREVSDASAEALVEAAERLMASNAATTQHHLWRYAQPRTTLDVGAVSLAPSSPVILAGEVFAGARVEGAYLSGLAAAEQMVTLLT